ncbi:LolA family protein [Algicella marina]|nr:outer membrane lipoprotein carrier protein LolA [Algicella marina]
MKRRTLITALAALPFAGFGSAAAAQDQVLVEVSKYLNQLRTIQGRFTQVNSDGSQSTGQYYLARPGLIRFEYDGGKAMVIADGINVGVLDAKSNAGAQKYPLSATPLRFLLRDQIDLTERNLSRGASSQNGQTSVVLQDPKAPKDGTMTLLFSNKPPALKQWTVTEKTGAKTIVRLDTLERASGLSRGMFSIEAAARKMGIRS